ncbi:DUF1127 domain-containing protein [Falsirhodobacter halotolerans]|uniref:DUF1127 domain-containing protein n=1 Tax=Falsirhodobacter halotolerans TaxID=1146892 RepID=UPI001FCFC6A1|nr:DUF1127 domain-containing protein [Falsirhodobacter halotolerans]MCJ8140316.1 DUF1127 domain-containing protein [Falsirhodobacter halotolerans]
MAQAVYGVENAGVRVEGGFLSMIKTALHRRAVYRQTVAELNALSTRDLADLGMSRSSIREVAFQAAYSK